MPPIRAVRDPPPGLVSGITARSSRRSGLGLAPRRRLCRVDLTVRLPRVNRRARPAVVGGGLVALCAAVAALVAALSGGPAPSAGALTAAATASASASAAAGTGGDPTSSATL